MDTERPPWDMEDEKLLEQCRFEAFVGSGPGGQHRNRTNTAVRIVHLPTGVSVVEQDSRSQRENKIHALRHLRHRLALHTRREMELTDFHPPDYLKEYPALRMSEKNPLYPKTMSLVLDVMKGAHWHVGNTAVLLGCSTSALVWFLHEDPPMWEYVQRNLRELGMKGLRWER